MIQYLTKHLKPKEVVIANDVEWAYRHFLKRAPESTEVIQGRLKLSKNNQQGIFGKVQEVPQTENALLAERSLRCCQDVWLLDHGELRTMECVETALHEKKSSDLFGRQGVGAFPIFSAGEGQFVLLGTHTFATTGSGCAGCANICVSSLLQVSVHGSRLFPHSPRVSPTQSALGPLYACGFPFARQEPEPVARRLVYSDRRICGRLKKKGFR